MTIKAWFPTFIYCAALQKAGSSKMNAELLKECYQIRQYDQAGRKWSQKNYPGGYTSYASLSKLHKMSSTFIELERKITRRVRIFAKYLDMELRGRKIEMTDCWINIMPKQTMHSFHLHPLSFVSGTYYVRTPRNCSRLKFEDPRLSSLMAAPPKLSPCRPRNQQYVEYAVAAGHVILFESWLRHEVSTNPAEEDRVSISFNYNWF
ncbi:MAG: hypothetical protein HY674_08940 [Chloroflexi bacterium]|nr:hypothetical protein [Chloroflexota bacterium]